MIKWGQVGNYMTCVCDSKVINCGKLALLIQDRDFTAKLHSHSAALLSYVTRTRTVDSRPQCRQTALIDAHRLRLIAMYWQSSQSRNYPGDAGIDLTVSPISSWKRFPCFVLYGAVETSLKPPWAQFQTHHPTNAACGTLQLHLTESCGLHCDFYSQLLWRDLSLLAESAFCKREVNTDVPETDCPFRANQLDGQTDRDGNPITWSLLTYIGGGRCKCKWGFVWLCYRGDGMGCAKCYFRIV